MSERINPPENEIPGALPLSHVIGRTDQLAVALVGAFVYSTGLSVHLAVRIRNPEPGHHDDLYAEVTGHRRRGGGDVASLLLGVEYPDGRTATNLGDWRSAFARDEDDDRPVLHPGGGGGGGATLDMDFWLWPLPPPGDVTIVCAWPTRGLDETRTTVQAADLAAARSRVVELWPWEPPAEPAVLPPSPPPDLPEGWFKDSLGGSSDARE